MKTRRSLVTFGARERRGLIVLLILIACITGILLTMRLWVNTSHDLTREQQLRAAYDSFATKRKADSTPPDPTEYTGKVNVNTADSLHLISLDGIGPAKAHQILRWRKYNGTFYSLAHFQIVAKLSQQQFDSIRGRLVR